MKGKERVRPITRLLQCVTSRANREALRFGDASTSWRALDDESTHAARALMAHGVKVGDRVAVYASSPREVVIAFLGALRAGAVWVPINPGYQRAELDHVLEDAAPIVTLVDEPLAHRPSLTLGALLATQVDERTALPTERDDDALTLLIYTSGTTGKSKGCMLSARNVVDATASLMSAWGMSERDTLVHALPLFHVHGLCVALCGALLSGARVHLLPKFTAEGVLDALARDGTVFMGVPTMFRRLLDQPDDAIAALGRARLLCSGSAPLPASDFEELRTRTGQRVVERYGMSETLITCTNPLEPAHGRRAGTVGQPLPGVRIRVVDDELWLQGPGVMSGYWNNPVATRESFEDGWLKTGDAVQISADGYVTILGRAATDFLKVGGYKISTREVEDALRSHPRVKDVAVVGMPDREWGERVVACIVPRGAPPSLAELQDHVQLHSAKKPRALLVVDELPKNAMGKIQKKLLAARAHAELA
jgi:acyl-CoA synthetase (AMP-forming)/AMP-acid ligase II